MKSKTNFLLLISISAITTISFITLSFATQRTNVAVLNPQGIIARQQYNLLSQATILSLIIIIPVFILTFFISWKYRSTNHQAEYKPSQNYTFLAKLSWWILPSIIIFILAAISWKPIHQLDHYNPIDSDKRPITIQVIALDWKWLFIYPEYDIATVNFIQFPQNTPITFELTADGPMNSFWIPNLGGQIYAMTGMGTKLHLLAETTGDFPGKAAEINGKGFSDMHFVARSSTQPEFDDWIKSVKESPQILNQSEYDRLRQPSLKEPIAFYSTAEKNLYYDTIMKFMMPTDNNIQNNSHTNMKGMTH